MSKRKGGKKHPGPGKVASNVEAIRRQAEAYRVRNALVARSRKKK